MKNYWLYLEPYTFLFSKNGYCIVYNSLSNIGKKFKNSGRIEKVVNQLNDISNMYCVDITEQDLGDSALLDFVNYIRNSFSGDLIDNSSFSKKPVVFIPKFKINTSIEQLQETDNKLTSDDILSYLKELTIYIGSGKPSSNLIDHQVYKQFDFNRYSVGQQLSIPELKPFISQVSHAPIRIINILGGNIFTYPELFTFAEYINHTHAVKIYSSSYIDIPQDLNQYDFLFNDKSKLRVLIDFPLNPEKFNQIITLFQSSKIQTEWLFAITSLAEYEQAEQLIESNNLDNASIKPVYTGENIQFFKDNVFLDEDDILNTHISREGLYRKQVLNTYDFGKLILMPDGKVYANANHQSIGTLNDSVVKMVLNEICNNVSWRRIREQEPCTQCEYQWLCPSPSNYELAIDKANLCSVIA